MVTKHMTSGDLLRIRNLMRAGVLDIGIIQQTVKIHASRIQQVLDAGLGGQESEAEEAAETVVEEAAAAEKPAKPTAAEKAKAKSAKKTAVNPVS